MAVSAAFHAIAVVALLTVHFSRDPVPPVEDLAVTLVAPRLTPPPPLRAPRAPKPAVRRPQPTAPTELPPPELPPVVAERTPPRAFRPNLPLPSAASKTPEIAPPAPVEIAPTLAPSAAPRADLAIHLPKPIVTGVLSNASATAAPSAPSADVKVAGFGNAQTSNATSPRGTATSVGGFGAASTTSDGPRQTASVRSSSFGDARTAAPEVPAQRSAPAAGSTPIEILSKPRPAYTEEARSLRIEGEVQLEVLFPADGAARVLRVVHGLGHGLNETAAAAARAIEFRPAKRAGVAVDSSAVVHIVFQLAY